MTSRMPAACKARAIAAPTRRAPPVTSATFLSIGLSIRHFSMIARIIISVAHPPARVMTVHRSYPYDDSLPADWPSPAPEERARQRELIALIRHEVDAAGGAIPFSRFMELALYAPSVGYYSAAQPKFG